VLRSFFSHPALNASPAISPLFGSTFFGAALPYFFPPRLPSFTVLVPAKAASSLQRVPFACGLGY
jgi:hypothetical protein